MQVSWARKKPRNHTTQKKKKKKMERKQREMKVKNVIVPVLVFLFSVVVFALFFFCLVAFFSLPILWRRFSPQLANNDSHFFDGKVRLEFLKFGHWKSVVIWRKLRPNHEIILVWKARQDRKYRVIRREEGKERKRKTKNQCCTLCFYIVYLEDSVINEKICLSEKIQLRMHA